MTQCSPRAAESGSRPERHLAGLDLESASRNPLIARTLFRSKEIESYGTGMPRIKKLCDDAGIRVEYRQTHDGTVAIFHRNDAFLEAGGGIRSRGIDLPETINETIMVPTMCST